MLYIGIDLSGPSNSEDTVLVVFREERGKRLQHYKTVHGAGDRELFSTIESLLIEDDLVIGLDAPLSYNPGGGDRPSDKQLRHKIVETGMRSGSVMTPTMTRMAYLTLRGITVARFLQSADENIKIAEVHPGGCMGLRGAPSGDIREMKKSEQARRTLLSWLGQNGLHGIPAHCSPSDHFIAACACALGIWQWHNNNPAWVFPASPPFHPFDFIC